MLLMNLLNLLSFLLLICSTVATKTIELTSNNLISIRGPINAFSASKFIHQTSNMQSNVVNIMINSPGGSISDGNAIIEQIKSLSRSNVRVNCICDFAASMAFIITQACPYRYGMSSSVMMQHQMSLSIGGELNRINSYMTYIEALKNSLDTMQSNRIGMKLATFQDKVKDEWWVYGKDNVNNNILDEIVILKCSNTLNRYKDSVKITTFFGEVILTYVGCPLVREPSQVIWNNLEKDKALKLAYDYIHKPREFIKYSV